jgi:arabinogalactan oligomer / maltooligosaccharide transport system permease protein
MARGKTFAATSAPVERTGFWQRSAESRNAYGFILPAGIIMTVITLYPLIYQVWMSFTDFTTTNLKVGSPAPNYVGFNNYTDILTGDRLSAIIPNFNFWYLLGFNLWWAFSNIIFHIILGVLIAVLLNVEGLWFKRIYRAIYILPVVIPAIIIGTVWKKIFDTSDGLINKTLGWIFGFGPLPIFVAAFGIGALIWAALSVESIQEKRYGKALYALAVFIPALLLLAFWGSWPSANVLVPWLDNTQPDFGPLPLAYFALLTANIWLGWPLNSVVATGALQSIPKDMYEAATVDGATSSQQFFAITVPFLRVAMIPFAMFGFITTFNLFHLSYFMSEGRPYGKTELLVTQAYKLVNGNFLYGMAAAFAIYMFFILLVISLVTNKITKATAEAV